jgi:outer membrane protein TolC
MIGKRHWRPAGIPPRMQTGLLPVMALLCLAPAARSDDKLLTWEECVTAAIVHNPDIRAAQQAAARAEASALVARGTTMPQVTLDAGYSHYEDDLRVMSLPQAGDVPTDEAPDGDEGPVFPLEDEFSISLRGRYDVYSGGRLSAEIRKGEAAQRQADARLDSMQHNVLCDLKRAFTRLMYAQRMMQLSRDIERRRNGNLALVRLRFEGGREHKGSFLFSKALHQASQIEIRQAERARKVAQRELARVMGQDIAPGLSVTGLLEFAQELGPTNLEQTVRSHPAHMEKRALLDSAAADVVIARSRFRPSVALSGSLAQYAEDVGFDQNRWSIGLALSVPLYRGGQNVHGLAADIAAQRQAGEELRGTRELLETKLEEAGAAVEDARQLVLSQQQLLAAAATRAEIAQEQYNSGLLKYENWDLIENDLIARQKRLLESLRNAILAEADLKQAQGTGRIP